MGLYTYRKLDQTLVYVTVFLGSVLNSYILLTSAYSKEENHFEFNVTIFVLPFLPSTIKIIPRFIKEGIAKYSNRGPASLQSFLCMAAFQFNLKKLLKMKLLNMCKNN